MAAKVLGTTRDGAACGRARAAHATPTRWRKRRQADLDIENFIAQSSSDLFARLSESDNDPPSPDVIKRRVPAKASKRALPANPLGLAAALEEKLDSLWKATEEQQFLELSALSSGVKLEEAAEEAKRQAPRRS